ncbi:PRC-barrel domain-containing protein [Jannaschia formosa]|uniref:PRC-barrel domain-containing protein n=1 Tax=Jannaschia formosa TaxID=2259592 RepID=UPI00142F9A38|nr:PRC-barrel domain-containing protein [Jannaschia formosa]
MIVLPDPEVFVPEKGEDAGDADRAAAPERDVSAGETVEVPVIGLTADVVSVADLIGQPVRDPVGETLGEVVDVLIDLQGAEARTLVYAPSPGFVDLSAIGLQEAEKIRVDVVELVIDPLDGAVILMEGAEDG